MKSSGAIDIYDETEFYSWVKMINVTLAEKNYCNMIEEHSSEMNNRKNINKDKYLENLPFSIRWKLKGEIYTYSTAGNVTLEISSTAEFLFETKTVTGKIQSDFPVNAEESTDKRKVEGQIGTKSNKVFLQTTTGSIKVLKKTNGQYVE
ncbi:DUF4097 family beta strand repeat-containing protein [Clostridium sporogenes]